MTGIHPDTKQKPTIRSSLTAIKARLNGVTDTPSLDARVMIAHILQKDQSWLFAHPDYPLTKLQVTKIQASLEKLTNGIPLPYVLGKWEFFSLEFRVTPDVLIPRPETELLVETALEWLKLHPGAVRLAEAGTGSGCISISLAVTHPMLTITATDIHSAALKVAKENAKNHQVNARIKFIQNDLLTNVFGQFDLICANLPYIPTETLHKLEVYHHEPTLALDGGADGFDLIRRLLDQGVTLLAEHGIILLEIEDHQGTAAVKLAEEKFPDANNYVKSDLAGKPRLLVIER